MSFVSTYNSASIRGWTGTADPSNYGPWSQSSSIINLGDLTPLGRALDGTIRISDSGNTMFIKSQVGSFTGVAVCAIYERDMSNNWVFSTKLLDGYTTIINGIGEFQISGDGNTAIITIQQQSSPPYNEGIITYSRTSNGWANLGLQIDSNLYAGATGLTGSPYIKLNYDGTMLYNGYSGIIQSYSLSGNTWSFNSNIAPSYSGYDFSFSDDYTKLLVANVSSEIVYYYTKSGANWLLTQTINSPYVVSNLFGTISADANLNTFVDAGQYFSNLNPDIVVYNRVGNNWSISTTIDEPDIFTNQFISINGSGNTIAAGGTVDRFVSNPEFVVFSKNAANLWQQEALIEITNLPSVDGNESLWGMTMNKQGNIIFTVSIDRVNALGYPSITIYTK